MIIYKTQYIIVHMQHFTVRDVSFCPTYKLEDPLLSAFVLRGGIFGRRRDELQYMASLALLQKVLV
jgi:hypothetical protein